MVPPSKKKPMDLTDISGFTKGGDYAKTVHLRAADGMRASILTLGARLLDLRLADGRPLALSLATLDEVEADPAYVGVAVGRTANRIRAGTLRRNGDFADVALECNEGRNHTHGGRRAWDKRLFAVTHLSQAAAELFLYSPDGDQGYPSSVEVTVRYELTGRGELVVSLVTRNVGFERTLTNMTLHPYFDLKGHSGRVRDSVHDYEVMAPSSAHYLVLDEENVPTGEVASVAETKFDFRESKKIADGKWPFSGYDQFFVASDETSLDAPMQSLVTVRAPSGEHGTGVEMEVVSNQPGFQMYTANGFDGSWPGGFEQYGSVAVEPSGYIDAGNNDQFPTIALEPSQTRRQIIAYRFRTLSA